MLESSRAIRRLEKERSRKTGPKTYPIVTLVLCYLIWQIRCVTLKDLSRELTPAVCQAIRHPSPSTVSHFGKHAMPAVADAFWLEFANAVMKRELEDCVRILVTVDSTPSEASRYNFDADFNLHYSVRMDKMHILMANGMPLYMTASDGNAADCEHMADLMSALAKASPEGMEGRLKLMTDAGYDAFSCFTDVFRASGSRPMISVRSDAVVHEDADRSVCETVHHSMKRWMDCSVKRLRRTTRHTVLKCRFMCLQILSALFSGYSPEPTC